MYKQVETSGMIDDDRCTKEMMSYRQYTTDRLGFQGAWTTVPDRGLSLLIGGGGIPEDAQRRRTVNRGILRCGVGT